MSSVFNEALGNFVKNFAYGDAVRHLLSRGYTIERIKSEYHYPLSIEELKKIEMEYRKAQV
ncbi:MAG: hypothetical protein Q4B70_10585 [Lachnospiraceae bacterium]|nr:hypothetical protein [Lachnospiraceae bacterium]